MLITTIIKFSTILKLLIFFALVILFAKNMDKIKNSLGINRTINYRLRRNTKTFFRNKYSIFNMNIFSVDKNKEDAKVYNINCEDVIRYDNGDVYKGQIKNGKREGLGICYFANKDVYEGMWKNDKMDCVGKYVFADKSFYRGDFKNGCKEGIGVFKCDDYKYIGQYYADKKGRAGTFHLPDGSYLKVIIENSTIVEGTYMRENHKDQYIYNVDLTNERFVIKNIKSYFVRDVSNI